MDTGPAHSDRDEENSNAQSHELAVALRSLIEPLGRPAVLALMHPIKNATRDNLQPRGGGAFSGGCSDTVAVPTIQTRNNSRASPEKPRSKPMTALQHMRKVCLKEGQCMNYRWPTRDCCGQHPRRPRVARP